MFAVRKRCDILRDVELGDRRIGVDISVDMHKFIVQAATITIAKAFHQNQLVDLEVSIISIDF